VLGRSGRSLQAIARLTACRRRTRPARPRIYADLRFTIPDSMLMKVDKMSMSVALECRSPSSTDWSSSRPRSGQLKLKGYHQGDHAGGPPGLPRTSCGGRAGLQLPDQNWLGRKLRDYMTGS
jgi:asparagine synthase (glutamine-hydrolysing)